MATRPNGTATWGSPFANDGGPLIVLPRALVGHWQGTDGTPPDADFSFGPDYSRACKAAHPAELIAVGPGFGLVIGSQEHLYPLQWLDRPGEPGAALIGWMYADDDHDPEPALLDLLGRTGPPWRALPHRMELPDGEMVLLHAASSGADLRPFNPVAGTFATIGHAISTSLEAGTYAITVTELGGELTHATFGCLVCRWLPTGRPS